MGLFGYNHRVCIEIPVSPNYPTTRIAPVYYIHVFSTFVGFKVAGAGYYNKILFITKHRNVCDVSVNFIKVR